MSKGISRKTLPRNINGKLIDLTDKQYEQVQAVLDSKDTKELITRTQEIYNTDRNSARAMLDENLKKPSIMSALDSYLIESEEVLSTTMKDYKRSEDINERKVAVDVAKFIHDKVTGKATQRAEVKNTIEFSRERVSKYIEVESE